MVVEARAPNVDDFSALFSRTEEPELVSGPCWSRQDLVIRARVQLLLYMKDERVFHFPRALQEFVIASPEMVPQERCPEEAAGAAGASGK